MPNVLSQTKGKGRRTDVARRRLAMRQIRDILRLYWEQRLTMRQIARSLGVGLTVIEL